MALVLFEEEMSDDEVFALLASLALVAVAVRTAREMSESAARKLFLASLLYHPVLLALMVFDTIRA